MSGRNFGKVSRNLTAIAILGAALLAAAPEVGAVPSFARQTDLACEACHTVYPELTHFGRVFKANGYILTNVAQVRDVTGKKQEVLTLAQTVPLSIMAQISYSQMKTSVPDLSTAGAPGVAQNGTAGFPQQLSLFYAGKVAPNFGAFFQITYANDSGTVAIDNTDLTRFLHEAIKIAFVIVVECAGGTGRSEDGKHEAYRLPPGQPVTTGDGNAGQRARRDSDADPELQELDCHSGCRAHGGFPIARCQSMEQPELR